MNVYPNHLCPLALRIRLANTANVAWSHADLINGCCKQRHTTWETCTLVV